MNSSMLLSSSTPSSSTLWPPTSTIHHLHISVLLVSPSQRTLITTVPPSLSSFATNLHCPPPQFYRSCTVVLPAWSPSCYLSMPSARSVLNSIDLLPAQSPVRYLTSLLSISLLISTSPNHRVLAYRHASRPLSLSVLISALVKTAGQRVSPHPQAIIIHCLEESSFEQSSSSILLCVQAIIILYIDLTSVKSSCSGVSPRIQVDNIMSWSLSWHFARLITCAPRVRAFKCSVIPSVQLSASPTRASNVSRFLIALSQLLSVEFWSINALPRVHAFNCSGSTPV